MTMAQGLIASSIICNSVVPSDDWTPMGLSLHSLIILTGGVSIDPGLEESYIFLWCLGCVFPSFPRHDTSYTYRTLSHPHPQHMPLFTSPYQIARPLLVTSRQASSQHVRDGFSRTIFVLVLRVVVTCLLLGVSLSRCAWNAKEHVHNQQFVGALRHLRTLNTTRPLRSDRRFRPGPGRHKSTGHGIVEGGVGVTDDYISPFLPLDLMM